MPGAGTDKTRNWVAEPAPVVILVESQLGENIGAAARAMANFGLSQLRLVKPQQGWPNDRARVMASGADRILEQAELFDTLADAIADCNYVVAATARSHDQAKPVIGADEAARLAAPRIAAGERVALVFGRERNGLENDEVGLADAILTLPVNPAFASLNLAQAIVIAGYEWYKLQIGGALPFATPDKSPPAPKEQLIAFFNDLENELERIEYFRPHEKRGTMTVNMRNIFTRMQPTQQDIRTLHGIVMALVEGRKGPARGGLLDGPEAEMLRNLLAQHGKADIVRSDSPVRGLARLLRRNPTDAERALWTAVTSDRRFATLGFKRQTPIGPHVADMVSFPLRLVVDVTPDSEDAKASEARRQKLAWMRERDYRIVEVRAHDIARDVGAVVDTILAAAEAG
ncbi:TrmJ/YjtD family RNA methyltransferase [Pseudorhodoplanes sp.]|uniref:TrmJ/YjtD family RNA methyltransferase n=1 Tax=Pseudorhodoplanes sp. TaxID=1934341 RepID=UPI002D0D7CF8|nr:TrmJ/YjtD family RNA methyltransferase [Pseudorhodoplanes sp.]HWV55198.1 TrmJ/YjtD family RNA methyltransferase [Pseudorhodoplanes sp.]